MYWDPFPVSAVMVGNIGMEQPLGSTLPMVVRQRRLADAEARDPQGGCDVS